MGDWIIIFSGAPAKTALIIQVSQTPRGKRVFWDLFANVFLQWLYQRQPHILTCTYAQHIPISIF